MDDRRTAAANYRLGRSSQGLSRARRSTDWSAMLKRHVVAFRDSLGHRLIALGERVTVRGPDPASEA